ncbi:lactate dehydrogenase [Helicobacter monodelphidis]|uniref:FAD-binding and (Fe-S)-binding domain-containing protein n=1 Tax=Helicobacter sp. 15-1451 TaxID=2004995 RepID=UPI000DCF2C17|nr:FAD-binding and (Fe-S)-binding domain-containing protein [Helicobacter sp. 15-1451]RAX56756.1 lactate dehydrogenase [Helicobacter sp. 15-1451]
MQIDESCVQQFVTACESRFLDRIYTDYARCFVYGVDASCYRYIPKVVVRAESEEEVAFLLRLAYQLNLPITFRGAGTSLSGQACGEGVLVLVSYAKIDILEQGRYIRCDCGVIGCEANEALKPYGRKIGPDPATINSAFIGGIVSNNSSGMCCGVKQNSYQTLHSLRVILFDGSVVDTADEKSWQEFLNNHSQLVEEIQNLRQQIIDDTELRERICHKFSIKNTTGYSLNALVDFSETKDIFNHLFVGAEGTLGFVSSVCYESVVDYAYKACALLFFDNILEATEAISLFADNDDKITAAEIMDYACLCSVQYLDGLPPEIHEISEGNCALLIQLEENSQEELESNISFLTPKIQALKTLFEVRFSLDAKEQESWWKIRKGILPIAAGNRPLGSTVITEDICFQIQDFTQGIARITELFTQYQFEGIIFGHALSGNVHFIITPNLSDEKQLQCFSGFMEALAELMHTFGGSIKAEHGTGRMVAPFVALEWGEKAYSIHQKIKKIFDFKGLINKDVIISDDPQIHLKNLKPATLHQDEIMEFIGSCMECGFCEKHCPSKNFTLTPRQRITMYREIVRLESCVNLTQDEQKALQELKAAQRYLSIETCATCSACANLCPLSIDTAKIASHIHKQSEDSRIATSIAKHLSFTSGVLKIGLKTATFAQNILGSKRVYRWSVKLNKALKTPICFPQMPKNNVYFLKNRGDSSQKVVYFSSCLNRLFAPPPFAQDQRSIQEVFESLCLKANFQVIYPQNLESLCCSKAFKDYPNTSLKVAKASFESLKIASEYGKIPIVCDHSACSLELLEKMVFFSQAAGFKLQVLDMPIFVKEFLLPHLQIVPQQESVAIYAPCATRHYRIQAIPKEQGGKRDAQAAILELGALCSYTEPVVHYDTKCCGFSGNKGFLLPELNKNALKNFKDFYAQKGLKSGYSSSSTCEIGLCEHTNFAWQHIIYLVDRCAKNVM